MVLCYDHAAWETCHRHHHQIQFCSDTRDWPKSGLSKLIAMAMIIEQGVDALWLDDDTLVLKDPTQHLKPLLPENISMTEPPAGRPEMLFQVEADSWNCVNNGIFLLRASPQTLRYLAYWTSLLLDRPVSIGPGGLGIDSRAARVGGGNGFCDVGAPDLWRH